jgi:ATP synthase F1 delta subunit
LNQIKIARRYALALMSEVNQQKNILAVNSDMLELKNLLQTNQDFSNFLQVPTLSAAKKSDILKVLLESEMKHFSDLTKSFLLLLSRKKRIELLSDILIAFQSLVDSQQNTIHASIESVNGLDENQFTQIKNELEKKYSKKIILTQKTNPLLLGGFMVNIDNTLIDLSVSNQLQKLKSRLISG